MFYVSIEREGVVTKTEFTTELEARQFAVSDVLTKMWDYAVDDEEYGDGPESKYLWEYKDGAGALLNTALPTSYSFGGWRGSWKTEITQS